MAEGLEEGLTDGDKLGLDDGLLLGLVEGEDEGEKLGTKDGAAVLFPLLELLFLSISISMSSVIGSILRRSVSALDRRQLLALLPQEGAVEGLELGTIEGAAVDFPLLADEAVTVPVPRRKAIEMTKKALVVFIFKVLYSFK